MVAPAESDLPGMYLLAKSRCCWQPMSHPGGLVTLQRWQGRHCWFGRPAASEVLQWEWRRRQTCLFLCAAIMVHRRASATASAVFAAEGLHSCTSSACHRWGAAGVQNTRCICFILTVSVCPGRFRISEGSELDPPLRATAA